MMKPFEVTITMPSPEPALQMLLDANHWMEAWKTAMRELGLEDFDEGQVTCKIRGDGAVEIIMPDLQGRRFLVASAPGPEPTTSDRPAAKSKRGRRPCITIEEMHPVRPDDTLPDTPAARPRSTKRNTAPPDQVYPKVYPLGGGEHTNLREAVTMLASHVDAEHVLFLLPSPERTSWTVTLSAQQRGSDLDDTHLAGSAPVPGPVDSAAGRRRFAEPVSLVFARANHGTTVVTARSVLWAPVHVDRALRGVFLLLNAPGPSGFEHSDLEATQHVASLLAKRLQPA
ncbi:MAG: hypothetical protein QF464_10370 [Myxococcota bacterium]|jgi:hypothetical protein|nr:hypothetical protein [Myxococcota bacterium]